MVRMRLAGANPSAAVSGTDELPESLPGDWHVYWDERAANLEQEAGLPRELAEYRALVEVGPHRWQLGRTIRRPDGSRGPDFRASAPAAEISGTFVPQNSARGLRVFRLHPY